MFVDIAVRVVTDMMWKCEGWTTHANELQAMMTKKLVVKMVMAGKMTWKTLLRAQAVETSTAD